MTHGGGGFLLCIKNGYTGLNLLMEMVQQQTRKKPAKPASLEQEFRGVFVIIEFLGTGVSVVCHAHGMKHPRGLPSLSRSFLALK